MDIQTQSLGNAFRIDSDYRFYPFSEKETNLKLQSGCGAYFTDIQLASGGTPVCTLYQTIHTLWPKPDKNKRRF